MENGQTKCAKCRDWFYDGEGQNACKCNRRFCGDCVEHMFANYEFDESDSHYIMCDFCEPHYWTLRIVHRDGKLNIKVQKNTFRI